MSSLRVVQLGNFGPPHSTENHLLRALTNNGHTVTTYQESDPEVFTILADELRPGMCDMILWTRTGWDWGDRQRYTLFEQRRMMRVARAANIPVVGYHLDIWWGLKRQTQIQTEPFFEVDLLCTADGGHPQEWADAGINHVWMPPGVSEGECVVGTPRDEFRSPIAFVGSHDGSYHPEHAHRHQLVAWLRQNFRRDCAFWPRPGQPAVRGKELQDLYASVDVVVGDSCFAGTGLSRYVSDRLPESTGRAGFLLHPRVRGVTDGASWRFGPTWTEGEHLACWDAGNWDELGASIEKWLALPSERRAIALAGREHVLQHHTYEQRMRQLVDLLHEEGLLH